MKKIINNRKYDTDTATKVGEWENMPHVGDFAYFCEALYRKRNGEYFVHGSGNAASKYAKSTGDNNWGGSDEIIPLSYDAARRWAEEHLDTDEYEREFGEVSEDGGPVVLSVRVSASAKAALDRSVAQSGRSRGEIVTELLLSL